MAYVGQVWKAKGGRIDDYREAHREVWPELESLFSECGVNHYVIYAWGEILFSHMDVEDYATMIARFNDSPIGQKWEVEAMGDLVEYPDVDPATGWPTVLEEVWHLSDPTEVGS